MPYVIDRRQIPFWKNTLCSDNMVNHTLAVINRCKIIVILSRYHIVSMDKMIND